MTENRPVYPSIKLHRPRAVAGWIARSRLLNRLDQVLHRPVALISAPAGFGKTTLISQWLDGCPLPNAWVQMDESDHEIPVFLSGVVAALRQLFPDCLQKTAELVQAISPIPLEIWKSALVDDLELLEETPFVLALDDYHLVANPAIDLLLVDVLCCAPLPMHLIISARRSPSLSFSRLTVQHRVVDIRPADLRFTDAEASQYFIETARLSLNESFIFDLQEKTEGWAAGLALAAISMSEGVRSETIIAHLDGPEAQVSDYLLDQVFSRQPAEIQEFLLQTATFDQFCVPMLCEAFGGRQSEGEIQALLERVEAAQLFLTPLDSPRLCYRYHYLFRQMLLSRQRFHFNPQQIEQFHRRAAVWLIRQGQIDDALNHLLAVRDWTGAAQLVEGQFCSLLNAEDYQGIKRRLGYFSEDFIASRPGLLLMQLWIAHFAMRVLVTQSLNARIQMMLDASLSAGEPGSSAPPPGFEAIPREVVQAQVWIMESIHYYLTNQSSQALVYARKAIGQTPETWQFIHGIASIYCGLSQLMEGEYNQAVERIQQEYERLRNPSNPLSARLLLSLCAIYLVNGDLELCRQTAEQLLNDALASNLPLIQGWGYYMLGRVYQEWNQLDLAAGYYLQGVEMRFSMTMVPALECVAGYAYILQILDRGEQAQQFLSSLGQIYGDQATGTLPAIQALTAWLNIGNGRPVEARRWAEAFTVPAASQAILGYHLPHFYKAKILMETGQPGNGLGVSQLLDEIQALAERTHNNFMLVRVLALRAVWLVRSGESASAQQTLERALHLGRAGWFIHSFVKQGPEMLALLQNAACRRWDVPGMNEYIAAILDAFAITGRARATAKDRDQVKTLLTERETEVLNLLAERLSIYEISSRLFISPRTVQQHTHHIYRKLNVANKRQAVASARELGIILSDR